MNSSINSSFSSPRERRQGTTSTPVTAGGGSGTPSASFTRGSGAGPTVGLDSLYLVQEYKQQQQANNPKYANRNEVLAGSVEAKAMQQKRRGDDLPTTVGKIVTKDQSLVSDEEVAVCEDISRCAHKLAKSRLLDDPNTVPPFEDHTFLHTSFVALEENADAISEKRSKEVRNYCRKVVNPAMLGFHRLVRVEQLKFDPSSSDFAASAAQVPNGWTPVSSLASQHSTTAGKFSKSSSSSTSFFMSRDRVMCHVWECPEAAVRFKRLWLRVWATIHSGNLAAHGIRAPISFMACVQGTYVSVTTIPLIQAEAPPLLLPASSRHPQHKFESYLVRHLLHGTWVAPQATTLGNTQLTFFHGAAATRDMAESSNAGQPHGATQPPPLILLSIAPMLVRRLGKFPSALCRTEYLLAAAPTASTQQGTPSPQPLELGEGSVRSIRGRFRDVPHQAEQKNQEGKEVGGGSTTSAHLFDDDQQKNVQVPLLVDSLLKAEEAKPSRSLEAAMSHWVQKGTLVAMAHSHGVNVCLLFQVRIELKNREKEAGIGFVDRTRLQACSVLVRVIEGEMLLRSLKAVTRAELKLVPSAKDLGGIDGVPAQSTSEKLQNSGPRRMGALLRDGGGATQRQADRNLAAVKLAEEARIDTVNALIRLAMSSEEFWQQILLPALRAKFRCPPTFTVPVDSLPPKDALAAMFASKFSCHMNLHVGRFIKFEQDPGHVTFLGAEVSDVVKEVILSRRAAALSQIVGSDPASSISKRLEPSNGDKATLAVLCLWQAVYRAEQRPGGGAHLLHPQHLAVTAVASSLQTNVGRRLAVKYLQGLHEASDNATLGSGGAEQIDLLLRFLRPLEAELQPLSLDDETQHGLGDPALNIEFLERCQLEEAASETKKELSLEERRERAELYRNGQYAAAAIMKVWRDRCQAELDEWQLEEKKARRAHWLSFQAGLKSGAASFNDFLAGIASVEQQILDALEEESMARLALQTQEHVEWSKVCVDHVASQKSTAQRELQDEEATLRRQCENDAEAEFFYDIEMQLEAFNEFAANWLIVMPRIQKAMDELFPAEELRREKIQKEAFTSFEAMVHHFVTTREATVALMVLVTKCSEQEKKQRAKLWLEERDASSTLLRKIQSMNLFVLDQVTARQAAQDSEATRRDLMESKAKSEYNKIGHQAAQEHQGIITVLACRRRMVVLVKDEGTIRRREEKTLAAHFTSVRLEGLLQLEVLERRDLMAQREGWLSVAANHLANPITKNAVAVDEQDSTYQSATQVPSDPMLSVGAESDHHHLVMRGATGGADPKSRLLARGTSPTPAGTEEKLEAVATAAELKPIKKVEGGSPALVASAQDQLQSRGNEPEAPKPRSRLPLLVASILKDEEGRRNGEAKKKRRPKSPTSTWTAPLPKSPPSAPLRLLPPVLSVAQQSAQKWVAFDEEHQEEQEESERAKAKKKKAAEEDPTKSYKLPPLPRLVQPKRKGHNRSPLGRTQKLRDDETGSKRRREAKHADVEDCIKALLPPLRKLKPKQQEQQKQQSSENKLADGAEPPSTEARTPRIQILLGAVDGGTTGESPPLRGSSVYQRYKEAKKVAKEQQLAMSPDKLREQSGGVGEAPTTLQEIVERARDLEDPQRGERKARRKRLLAERSRIQLSEDPLRSALETSEEEEWQSLGTTMIQEKMDIEAKLQAPAVRAIGVFYLSAFKTRRLRFYKQLDQAGREAEAVEQEEKFAASILQRAKQCRHHHQPQADPISDTEQEDEKKKIEGHQAPPQGYTRGDDDTDSSSSDSDGSGDVVEYDLGDFDPRAGGELYEQPAEGCPLEESEETGKDQQDAAAAGNCSSYPPQPDYNGRTDEEQQALESNIEENLQRHYARRLVASVLTRVELQSSYTEEDREAERLALLWEAEKLVLQRGVYLTDAEEDRVEECVERVIALRSAQEQEE